MISLEENRTVAHFAAASCIVGRLTYWVCPFAFAWCAVSATDFSHEAGCVFPNDTGWDGASTIGVVGVSEEDLGEGLADILSETFEVAGVVLCNSIVDFVEDLNSIDDQVMGDVVGEGPWALEALGHLDEVFDSSNSTFAGLNVI